MPDTLPDLFGTLPSPARITRLSRVKERLVQSALEIEAQDPESILYQHTALCSTALPYKDPGPNVREWAREQGRASLLIEAGRAKDPATGEWLQLGLPFGPKPRLIWAHLNAEALRTGSAEIEVERTLTAFARRLLGYEPNGHAVRLLKEQMARLAAANVHLAVAYGENRLRQVRAPIIDGFELWFAKDERQHVLWPTTVCLSSRYCESLAGHAVPLDERAMAALAHSAMALDVYAWLAQRLHRINPSRPQLVPWAALSDQFGAQFARVRKFREKFLATLMAVQSQYPGARLETDERGLILRHSEPPVKARLTVVRKP